jgi:hypothetical protein
MNYVFAVFLALVVSSARAMDSKDPLDYPLRFWLFPLLMALLGGFVSWYDRVKKGELQATNLFALMGEFAVSALAGLCAFLICDWLDVPIGVTGAVAGLAGHAGARALRLIEVIAQRIIEKRLGIPTQIWQPPDDNDPNKK